MTATAAVSVAGGPITTRFFARHPTVLQVGSTVFVHGGVLPSHVEYGLDKINKETQAWMLGHTNEVPPGFLRGATAIVWARDYSARQEVHCDCETLQSVLDNIPGAKRMVVSVADDVRLCGCVLVLLSACVVGCLCCCWPVLTLHVHAQRANLAQRAE